MKLVALQIGMPQNLDFHGRAWTSAIYKGAIEGRIRLERTNLDGDRQANLRFHGGPDKAVCCFASAHYPYWQHEFGLGEQFGYGAFGENFTIEGQTEETVCVGDVYAVGSAVIQVSQARMPCVNVARKWDRKAMPQAMMDNGQTGWYLRVLQTGDVGAGDPLELRERPLPDITIRLLNRAMYQDEGGPELWERLSKLPLLARSGRNILSRKLA